MIHRLIALLPGAFILAAFVQPGAQAVQQGVQMSSDAEVRAAQAYRGGPVRLEETPLFEFDPRRPAGMLADMERRPEARQVPTKLIEERARPRRSR